MHFGLNWALRLGVRLARELHLSRVIFEMDSLVVVSMINDGKTKITHLRPLLQDIVDMLQHLDWQVKVAHVYRETNRCADWLTSKGHSVLLEWVLVDTPCNSLGLLLGDDARGSCLPRPVA